MKHISIEIPDDNYSFVLELLGNLSFVKIKEEDVTIPEEHKNIVRERISASKNNPSRLIKWDNAQSMLKL